MKKIVFIIYLIFNCCSINAQKNYSAMLEEFDKVGNCNHQIGYTYFHPDLSKKGYSIYLVVLYVKTPSSIHEKFKLKYDSTIIFLYQNLMSEKYDYVSNLFLYQYAGRILSCGDSLKNCDLWKKYLKEKDIIYWKDYIKKNNIGVKSEKLK